MTIPGSIDHTPATALPGLHWAIKRSFVDYIARMPDGRGSVSDGATPLGDNVMVFEPESKHEVAVGTRLQFRGDVRFGGHYGMLFVRIANPHITIVGSTAELSIAGATDSDERLRLVTIELVPGSPVGGMDTFVGENVHLLPEGVGMFNDVYPAGEPFEPIFIALPAS